MNTWNVAAGAVLVAIFLVAYAILKRRNDDLRSKIDLDDLVMSAPQVDGVRRVSTEKVMLWGAFVSTTWGVVYMIGADKITDAIFIGYGAIWITPILSHQWTSKPSPTPPAP